MTIGEAYTRTRNRNYYANWKRTTTSWNSAPISSIEVTYEGAGNYIASGYKNPTWREDIKNGRDATTPYSVNVLDRDLPVLLGQVVTWTSNNPARWTQLDFDGTKHFAYTFIGSEDASTVTTVHNRLIQKFLEAADSARSSFELGQDIGELRETIESLIHPMKSLRELTLGYIDRAKRIARRYRGPSASRALADAWLEYRFGWRPLASDVADAYVVSKRWQYPDSIRMHVAAGAPYAQTNGSYSQAVPPGSFKITFRSTGRYSEKLTFSIRTGQVGGYRPLAQELQLDLPHFLPTVWDLIPYSWLVDYFTNVGTYIHALSFRYQDVNWCNLTSKRERILATGPWTFTPAINEVVKVNTTSGGVNTAATWVEYNRSRLLPEALFPTLQFELPLSSRPWENIAALLASRLL